MSWKRVLTVVWVANFVTAIGMNAMVPFLTWYVEDLGVTDPYTRNLWAGVLVAAAPLVAAVMAPLWGSLGDRLGARVMILRALGAITVFVGLMRFAPSVEILLILRILQGFFSGFMAPSIAYVSLCSPSSKQGWVTGRLQSAFPAGAAVGFVIGGWLAHLGMVEETFSLCAILGAVSFVAVAMFLRGAPTGLVAREVGSPSKLSFGASIRTVLGVPGLLVLMGGLAVVRAAISCVDPSYTRYVVECGGDNRLGGILFSIQSVMLLIFMPIWGNYSDKRGPGLAFAMCSVALAISFGLQSIVPAAAWLIPLRALGGVAVAGIMTSGYSLAARRTSDETRGAAMGIVFSTMALSHAIGSGIGGVALNWLGFPPLLQLVGLVIGVVGLSGFVFNSRRSARCPEARSATSRGGPGSELEGNPRRESEPETRARCAPEPRAR